MLTPDERRARDHESYRRHCECDAVLRARLEDMPAYLARSPTRAQPGSPTKLKVLAARVQHGEPLFHPGDAGSEGWARRLMRSRIA